jgi:hypothetical protein
MFKRSILPPLFSFFCLFLLSSLVLAQGTTSRVTGTVTDSSGAAVAGASVTLTNEGTGVSLTTETSDSGSYTFDLLQIGTYQVTVEKTGFKKFVSKGNTINVNQPATINAALDIGDVSAVVVVEGSAEQVQTSTSGNVGSTIDQRSLEAAPIVGSRGRNPLSLMNFQPGVTTAGTAGGVHIHGSRDRAFNYTLDGIDINESSNGGANFTPLRPNPDSLEEFQVVTSGFTAELGRSSGAQVTLVTKSGTNEFRGNLFEFYQTPGAMANSYGNNLLGIARPKSIQHIFGGSLGGPLPLPNFGEGGPAILRNKAFFFVNLQMLRQQQASLVQRDVYTQSARDGIFRYVRGGTTGSRNAPFGQATNTNFPSGAAVNVSGGQIYPNCTPETPAETRCTATYSVINNPSLITIDPNLLKVINSTPLPNDFSRGDGLNIAGYNFTAPTTEKQYDLVMKFDFKIDPKNQFYFRYAEGEQNTIADSGNSGQPPFPGFPNIVNTERKPRNWAVNYRWAPTSNIANEFILGYSKFTFFFGAEDFSLPFAFTGVTTPGTNALGNGRGVRTWQFIDNLTWVRGSHTFKGGINFRFGLQTDDRSSVGSSVVEGQVNFDAAVNSNFNAFSLPGTTVINSNDLSRLRQQINNFLGRVGVYNRSFVVDATGQNWAPAGTRWIYKANYGEYDFYFQDTWRVRQNLVFDLGVRWEPKLSPTSDTLPIVRPNTAVTLGSAPSNTVRWVEGPLFDDDWNNFSPSVGFAWDPFSNGKTSIRANYRLSYDRAETHLFGQNIFQNSPGNNATFPTDNTFGASGGLYRNITPIVPSGTPAQLRQPPAIGTGGQVVIDPNIQFPTVHQWYAGFQREIWFDSVLEVNYIGKRGLHLFGGYNANQVDIRDNSFQNTTFLSEFINLRNNRNVAGYQNAYFNALLLGDSRISATDVTATRMLLRSFGTEITNGSVAGLANSLTGASGGRVWIANTGNPFYFQNYPQFGQLTVIDSNDSSTYNGLEIIVKKRFSRGLSFQVGYTLSKSMDSRSFDPVLTTISTASSGLGANTPFDNNNRSLNWAYSDFDRRHMLQGTFVFALPFGKTGSFLNDVPRPVDWVIGGWQLAGNFIVGSGRPFTVFGAANTLSQSIVTPANCNGCSRDMGEVIQRENTNYFFTAEQELLFSTPGPGEFSNVGRNYFIGPRQYQLDLALSKKFRLTERMNFDLRVEATNVTNTPNFAIPNQILNSSTAPFGRIRQSVVNDARRVQFAGKFNF